MKKQKRASKNGETAAWEKPGYPLSFGRLLSRWLGKKGLPIASLNYLLTSHVWRQDHNGFSHQDPGFIDHVMNKKAEIVRVYLPPDANTLLSVTDHCLRSKNYVNVIVAAEAAELAVAQHGSGDSTLHGRRRYLALGRE